MYSSCWNASHQHIRQNLSNCILTSFSHLKENAIDTPNILWLTAAADCRFSLVVTTCWGCGTVLLLVMALNVAAFSLILYSLPLLLPPFHPAPPHIRCSPLLPHPHAGMHSSSPRPGRPIQLLQCVWVTQVNRRLPDKPFRSR